MTEPAQIGQPQRVTIDGTEYRLRPWDYVDAQLWAFRLAGLLLKSGSGAGNLGAALAALSEPMWTAYCALVAKYTDVIGQAEGGGETVVPLDKVSAVHMRGRLATLVELANLHTVTEFRDFFARAVRVIAAAGPSQGETK